MGSVSCWTALRPSTCPNTRAYCSRVASHPSRFDTCSADSAGLANPLPVGWVHPLTAPPVDQSAFTRRLLARQTRLQAPPGTRAA